jgi:hypothetical protein
MTCKIDKVFLLFWTKPLREVSSRSYLEIGFNYRNFCKKINPSIAAPRMFHTRPESPQPALRRNDSPAILPMNLKTAGLNCNDLRVLRFMGAMCEINQGGLILPVLPANENCCDSRFGFVALYG